MIEDVIADELESLQRKGVRVWASDGQLHYKAPKGLLTQTDIERLRTFRIQILALLKEGNGLEPIAPTVRHRSRTHRAPLAFSQLAHWNLYRLSERRADRIISSATRLRGRLNIEALQRSLSEMVRRHETLRTRVIVCDGVPTQEIFESGDCKLQVIDLMDISEHVREAEIIRRIETLILEPIDVAIGPLFAVQLLSLGDKEHVLIIAMEHMISDGFSLNILTRDLFIAYTQIVKGGAISLPPVQIQFADYATLQRNAESWITKHGAYWNERLAGCQRLRFPDDSFLPKPANLARGTVSCRIPRELKMELCEWCRLRRTTVVMSVFVAYVGLVLRWCNAQEAVFQYQSNGRTSSKIEDTIGYFAGVLYLRLRTLENDSFVDLLDRVRDEYCMAYEHADSYFIAAQLPQAQFTRNTRFNWVSQESFTTYLSALSDSENALTCSPVRFVYPAPRDLEIDREPFVMLSDVGDEIFAEVYFSQNRSSVQTMERFARNFVSFVAALVRQSEQRLKDVTLLR